MQKTNQKEFRVEEVIKREDDKYMSNGKAMIIRLTVGLIKKRQYKWVNILGKENLLEEEWKLN